MAQRKLGHDQSKVAHRQLPSTGCKACGYPQTEVEGVELLGVPTVLDRLIQQAFNQVLTPLFDPNFVKRSYGFRPGRSAIQAVTKAQEYQHEGKRWLVDLALEKFFDIVNHDILMQCLREKVNDIILLKLIGRYLRAGIMLMG